MNTPNLFQVAEVQLTYKNHADLMKRPQIAFDTDLVNLIRELDEMKLYIDYKEVFYAVYLNQNYRVLSVGKVSEGTTTNCLINTRQILQSALLQNATGIMICHNHPSGDVHPSREDIACTSRIKEAAKLLDIQLLDSFVISSFNYYSFVENGLL